MKSPDLRILTSIFDDVEDNLSVSLNRDKIRLIDRVKNEGFSFLSKTLPLLDDALLQGLSSGSLPRIRGWSVRGCVPKFLNPLWIRVFDEHGYLKSEPCVLSIRYIRQISRMYKKIFSVCEDRYVTIAINDFVDIDENLSFDDSHLPRMRKALRLLFPDMLYPSWDDISGFHHGPGAVAEKYSSQEKNSFPYLPLGFHDYGDASCVRLSWSHYFSDPPIEFKQNSRLIAVPKTATKPRLISIEPAVMQFLQQGLEAYMLDKMQRNWFSNYRDQEPNQHLARLGSIDSSFATIDLSAASDRVHNGLVEGLFKGTTLGFFLQKFRTEDVDLPSGKSLHLKKFASMGSATTFPVQIIVFSTIVCLGIADARGISLESSARLMMAEQARIYGDDIIIPTDTAGHVMKLLESNGLKVNTDKSFYSGNFRESCGSDWFYGFSVKPIYARKIATWGTAAPEVVSLLSLRNQLWETAEYPKTVTLIDSLLSKWRLSEHNCYLRHVDGTRCSDRDTGHRWNPALMRVEFRSLFLKEKRRRVSYSGDGLTYYMLNLIGSDYPGYDRALFDSRPYGLVPNVRWQS